MLELMAAEPALAQLLMRRRGRASNRRWSSATASSLIPALEGLWERDGEPPRPAPSPGLAFGRAQLLIFNQVAAGRAERLPELLPEIVYLALPRSPATRRRCEQARLAGDAARRRAR